MRGIYSIIFGGVIAVVAAACQGTDEHAQAQPEVAVSATACANCGQPLGGLTADQLDLFNAGLEEFSATEDPDEGLGPVFNANGCGTCHNVPAIGGPGTFKVTRFGRTNDDGSFDPLAELGGSLRQDHGIGELGVCGQQAEVTPDQANTHANRRTTALWGFGLLAAVPDDQLRLVAQLEPAAIRGIPNEVTDVDTGEQRVGRFGWKAQVATLRTFAGDAYVNEMGITNPLFPTENCPQGDCNALIECDQVPDPEDDGTDMQKFADFMQFLAPPARGNQNIATTLGNVAFIAIGCAGCHTPTLFTGSSDVAAIDHQTIHPYSDFLLHDMGALGDGITQGAATGRLMKTPPLWGTAANPFFLHDGRAASLDEAIRAHDGQGRGARNRYVALDGFTRALVLAFLNSL
jgi:CxxC motif-containing protein (DUF1111 family)